MPIFLSEEEFRLISNDASAVADRADAFIFNLRNQIDLIRSESDAKSISDEQNCNLIEQKYASLYSDFSNLQHEYALLSASYEKCQSELVDSKNEKQQICIKAIGKDGEIEKLSVEVAELYKSEQKLLKLVEQKDAEITERNRIIQSYDDKIILLSENNSSKDSRVNEIEEELMRCQATCTRLTQEKEILEKQNVWLDEELMRKANTLFEMRRTQMHAEAETSGKIADLERQVKEYSFSLNQSKERIMELELRAKSLEEDLRSSNDNAATTEEHFDTELSTVNKLVELYKASSEEWSTKAGELEGVIKALETHMSQGEDDYKEKLEKETSLRKRLEKEYGDLKTMLEKCEAELENNRKANELCLLPLSMLPTSSHVEELVVNEAGSDVNQLLVPKIAAGVSGTALAVSLLRDGWNLSKLYERYQEISDSLWHEKWGRKHAEAVLERVLHEIEEKAEMILGEREEHQRVVEAYATMNEKLQQALAEHECYENTLRKLKAELRRHEREYSIAQKEINDLQKQVTVLLKECQNVQIGCGDNPQISVENITTVSTVNSGLINAETIVSEQLFYFKDLNELVEQNVKLRSLVRRLSADEEKKETELRYDFQIELQRVVNDASAKVEAVLKRSEEQASMIESLHNSVAMYKRLYEEENTFRTYGNASATDVSDDSKKELVLLLEGPKEASKNGYEQLSNRARILEEDVARLSTELISARAERDKMSLEANFSKEKLVSFMKEFDQQRSETNAVSARNMELSLLLIDHEKKLRHSSASLQASEENSWKLSMEVSVLKHERETLLSSGKRSSEEVNTLMERVNHLQSSLDAIQSAEEVREISRVNERRKQDDYLERLERDCAEAKRELQEKRDSIRILTFEKERAFESFVSQMEDIRKELANACHSVANAESRAAVAEARCSDLEAKIKIMGKKAVTEVGNDDQLGLSSYEISELRRTKEELENVKEEVSACKEYMLQYKEIARVNEIALKKLESEHEDYNIETVKMKKLLEDEIQSLKNQVLDLEKKYMLKCEEAASATEAKEKALSSAMAETSRLRDEVSEKLTSLRESEVEISSLKEDLAKEHKRWCIAQDLYERQVILQSETIQELANTSRELSVLQEDNSRLRGLLDVQKTENELMKLSWETEKSELQQMKNEAERNCNEMHEQNRILHNRLKTLHDRLAKKHNSGELLSFSSQEDDDLQTVISYLRRSNEIAQTEIDLLKQEKLRLQSTVISALDASESAQALLHSQLEEFKSLQLQVQEIKLLRESNAQLAVENRHNFEECQRFHEDAQKAKTEAENLERLLMQKQIELDGLQKGSEFLKIEISNLNNRNAELLESCKNISINEYKQMKAEFEQMKSALATKQELIMKLEQDLTNCQEELSERERRLYDAQNAEANFKQELDKQKKLLIAWKNKNQSITKEKEELNIKYQALTKEIEDLKVINQAIMKEKDELSYRNQVLAKEKDDISYKFQALSKERDELMSKRQTFAKENEELNSKSQAILKQNEDLKLGKKVLSENEQVKKEQEKDTRIQMLEKTLERARDENRNEKQLRKKSEAVVIDFSNKVTMEKQKLEDELQKHKRAMSAVLEKVGMFASQLPSQNSLDEQTIAYFQSVISYEAAKDSFLADAEGSQNSALILDNVSASTGQNVPTPQTKLPKSNFKFIEEREKASVVKTIVEARKPVRRFVRPSLVKYEEPTIDNELTGVEISTAEGKARPFIEHEVSGDSTAQPTLSRKRNAPPDPEILEASVAQDETNNAKRAKESELSEISETHNISEPSENPDTTLPQAIPQLEVSEMQISQTKDDLKLDKLPSASEDGFLNTGNEEEDNIPVNEESTDQQKEHLDIANPKEVKSEGDKIIMDLPDTPDQGPKKEEIMEVLYSANEAEREKEEGELLQDEHEQQQDDLVSDEGVGSGDEGDDAVEIASPNNEQGAHNSADVSMLNDADDIIEDCEKQNTSSIEQATPLSEISQQNLASGQLISSNLTEKGDSQQTTSSRTISISEMARRNAQIRQASLATQLQQQQQQQQQQQKPSSRGQILPYRRGGRGRGGRG